MKIEEAQRLSKLPIYVFALLDKLKADERAKGKDLIDLTIGSPSHLPPKEAIAALIKALEDPKSHKYSSFEGDPAFIDAVCQWCKQQYSINIHKDEVVTLVGSKEGLAHFYLAFLNPGDTLLVPLPMYPSHFRGPVLTGAEPIVLPTVEKNGFLPELDIIDKSIADKAKILSLSYPTNPTAATAPREFFEKAVRFAKKHNLILIHDFAYAELYFEGQKPISCLSVPGAKDVCIEFHSLSKTFGMAGWRLGFAVGNKQLINALKNIKTNLDYGPFAATVKAGTAALKVGDNYLDEMRQSYQRKRDIAVNGLNSLGWQLKKPLATFYLWVPVPSGFNAMSFVEHLMHKADVAVSPGIGFGDLGEGYVRFALVETDEKIAEAISRMKKAGIKYNG
ncbi:MAG: aminotransferase class I/II-fold pyridoxal phosphate-dependent enzyme [Candidatus Margulisbacteria bacterium]|nr:aminotransferase class I/II-fold pyridoxal phosphate-dependent enzyme [Candidatus Margulisiibacteriota bacterium]